MRSMADRPSEVGEEPPRDRSLLNWRTSSLARRNATSALAVTVLMICTAQLFFGALRVGATYDELSHVDRMRTWMSTGWYMPESFLDSDDQPNKSELRANPYVYGPAYSVLAHIANIAAGNEGISEISESRNAYNTRHVVSASMGLLGA